MKEKSKMHQQKYKQQDKTEIKINIGTPKKTSVE